jgi:hypothetical protein
MKMKWSALLFLLSLAESESALLLFHATGIVRSSFESFKGYLLGTRLKVCTDHRALLWLHIIIYRIIMLIHDLVLL